MARTKMPKTEMNYRQVAQDDFLKEVDSRCVWAGYRTNEALGKAVGVTGRTIGNHKQEPGKMKVEVLQGLVKTLQLSPVVVLRYLGYSTQDIRKFAKEYIQ